MRQIRDNIGTPSHPVWLTRLATPLTPGAVRAQLLAAPGWMDEAAATKWRETRRTELPHLLTPLDLLLIDEEANALERYVAAETVRAGRASSADWLGDTRGGGRAPSPVPDAWHTVLAAHARIRRRLGRGSRDVLTVLCGQMWGAEGALTPALAAIALCLPGRNRQHAYYCAVRDAARDLVSLGY